MNLKVRIDNGNKSAQDSEPLLIKLLFKYKKSALANGRCTLVKGAPILLHDVIEAKCLLIKCCSSDNN